MELKVTGVEQNGMRSLARAGRGAWLALLLLLPGCASGPYAIELMPAPSLYDEGRTYGLASIDELAPGRGESVLYATLRPPAEGYLYPFYEDERDYVTRLGKATVLVNGGTLSPEEAFSQSLMSKREIPLRLTVEGVEEFGILDNGVLPFAVPIDREGGTPFTQATNALLEGTEQRDIVIYVHGYKVPFSDPILVTAELWHYLEYAGVFVAYSWPSTPSVWAYFSDADTAIVSAHGLRELIRYLSAATIVERIHIIGYSAGTRVVIDAMHHVALIKGAGGLKDLRIGNVILAGSDVDRGVFGVKLSDGLLDQVETLTIYLSDHDIALSLLNTLGLRERTGQPWAEGEFTEQERDYLFAADNLAMISVSDVAGATEDNGHGYFRRSPWVSSDIIALLSHDLPPDARGLMRRGDEPIWVFPEDYPERVRAAVSSVVER